MSLHSFFIILFFGARLDIFIFWATLKIFLRISLVNNKKFCSCNLYSILYLLHVPFAEVSLPLAWIGHELYGHAIQYAYIADSVFLFIFIYLS